MPDGYPKVVWTRAMLERFKQAYNDTKGFDDSYVFLFDGNEFVKSYARHLIQYLEDRLR